jgi:hypothetical protein
MTLKQMPKVGDKVKYIGGKGAVNKDVTYGTIYEITSHDYDVACFIDDSDEDESVIMQEDFDKFEIVTEPSKYYCSACGKQLGEMALGSHRDSGSYCSYECVNSVTEPTPVEASPTVIELLANISRRIYEAERTIKEQAYEINELYKAVADRG